MEINKKIIIIAVCCFLLGAGAVYLILMPGGGGTLEPASQAEKTDDEIRSDDMNKIFLAQYQYLVAHKGYYQSAAWPAELPGSGELPRDPSSTGTYFWLDNTHNPAKFCVYAALDEGGFLFASHQGVGKLTTRPVNPSDCQK